MQSFDPLGHLLNRLTTEQDTSREKLSAIDHRLGVIEEQIKTLSVWLKRAVLLITLWGAALLTNVSTDQKAEVLAMLIKQLTR